MTPLVLLVEDSVTCAHHLASRLRRAPHRATVEIIPTLTRARAWLASPARARLTLAVLDRELPDGLGTDLLPLLVGVPVLLVTSSPERVSKVVGFELVEKGPAWASRVEAALVRAVRRHEG
jgi:DNA-binding response OmpR family regulator